MSLGQSHTTFVEGMARQETIDHLIEAHGIDLSVKDEGYVQMRHSQAHEAEKLWERWRCGEIRPRIPYTPGPEGAC